MACSNPPWDVNKYRSEFEPEEHWELRKKFMLTHMDKFTEDRLVCLSKVFFNMEFLGCRYPEKTMKLVEELSKGIADDHREKQKGKLKRTFVKASDAAEAKIKGQGVQPPVEPPEKLPRERIAFCPAHVNLTKPLPQPTLTGDFPGLILFENCNKYGYLQTCPINILINSVQKNQKWNTITFSKDRICEIKINNKLLTSAEGSTAKEAKLNAAVKGLDILRQTCYTIQVKRNFVSDGPSITKNQANESDNPLPQDNIGCKIMQKMGWSGSGLGKSQQGIQDPVLAAPQIMKRSGFGSVNPRELQSKFRQCFKDYIKGGCSNDLVFSPDFTSEERKSLHKLAQSFNLKTRSYGKDNDRHLVVTKQLQLPELLQSLLVCGGENEKYLLIPPTDLHTDRISSMPIESVVKQEFSEVTTMPIGSLVKQELSEVTTMPDESLVKQELSKVTSIPIESVVKQELSKVTTIPIESLVKQELSEVSTIPMESLVKQELSEVSTIPMESLVKQELSEVSTIPFENFFEQDIPEVHPVASETPKVFVYSSTNKNMYDSHITHGSSACSSLNNNFGFEEYYESETVRNPDCSTTIKNVFTPYSNVTLNDDADMKLVDEVLQKKDSNLQTVFQDFKNIVNKFKANGKLAKTEKSRYNMCRVKLQKYTGKFVPSMFKRQNVEKQPCHRSRCNALGLALLRNSPKLQKLLCEQIKTKSPNLQGEPFQNEANKNKLITLINRQMIHFGDVVIKHLLNNKKMYKTSPIDNPIFDSLIATNFDSVKDSDPFVINEELLLFSDSDLVSMDSMMPYLETLIAAGGTLTPKKVGTGYFYSKRFQNKSNRYEIKFVTEKGSELISEESEIENSDNEDILVSSDGECTESLKTKCQRIKYKGGQRFPNCVSSENSSKNYGYQKFISSIARQGTSILTQQKTRIEEQTTIKTVSLAARDKVQVNSSITDLEQIVRSTSLPTELSLKQQVSDSKILTKHNSDEIDKFFSDLAVIAKSLPPDILKQLKNDINTDVVKALNSNKDRFT